MLIWYFIIASFFYSWIKFTKSSGAKYPLITALLWLPVIIISFVTGSWLNYKAYIYLKEQSYATLNRVARGQDLTRVFVVSTTHLSNLELSMFAEIMSELRTSSSLLIKHKKLVNDRKKALENEEQRRLKISVNTQPKKLNPLIPLENSSSITVQHTNIIRTVVLCIVGLSVSMLVLWFIARDKPIATTKTDYDPEQAEYYSIPSVEDMQPTTPIYKNTIQDNPDVFERLAQEALNKPDVFLQLADQAQNKPEAFQQNGIE